MIEVCARRSPRAADATVIACGVCCTDSVTHLSYRGSYSGVLLDNYLYTYTFRIPANFDALELYKFKNKIILRNIDKYTLIRTGVPILFFYNAIYLLVR